MAYQKLSDLRNNIDALDVQIADLLNQRMHVTDQVGKLKQEKEIAFDDPEREGRVINHLKNHIHHSILHEEIELIYRPLIDLVKKSYVLQQKYHALPWNHIGVIGLGVIGGSIMKSLRAIGFTGSFSTIEREGSTNNMIAKEQGYITHEYRTAEELAHHVDLLILASPIDTVESFAQTIASNYKHDSKLIVIDVASIKRHIGKTFEALTTHKIEFLATHPMAGSDKSGFNHAKATLFVNNPWIICAHEKNTPETISRIHTLISSAGARCFELPPAVHDTYVASSSHLVRLVSMILFAFMHDKKNEAMQIAGTGFEKMSALTSSNPVMNTQIYQGNFEHIHHELKEFAAYISSFELSPENSLSFFEKYKSLRDAFLQLKKKK